MATRFVAGRFRSIRYALAGIAILIRTQRNAWVHFVATIVVVAAGALLRISGMDWCWLIMAMTAVWTAEGMNTAVEILADVVSPEHHPAIGRAKDVAAGAVLLAAAGSVAIGVCVLGPPLVGVMQ